MFAKNATKPVQSDQLPVTTITTETAATETTTTTTTTTTKDLNQSITITPITSAVAAKTAIPLTLMSKTPLVSPSTAINTATTTSTLTSVVDTTVVSEISTSIKRTPQQRTKNKSRSRTYAKAVSPRTPITTPEVRRSSSRFIKRKRFDDEIVEYSINYPQVRDQHRNNRQRNLPNTTLTSPVGSTSTSTPTIASPVLATKLTAAKPALVTGNVNELKPQIKQQKQLNTVHAKNITTTAVSKTIPTLSDETNGSAVAASVVSSTEANVIASTSTVINDVTSALVAGKLQPLPNTINASTNNTLETAASTSSASRLSGKPRQIQSGSRAALAKQAIATERRRAPRTNRRRRVRTKRPSTQAFLRELGRWKPSDDLTLIIGVQQTQDLRVIHRACKFSCRFTLQEIQARWYSLLYEPTISRTAIAAMRNLHPEMIESIQRKALFSNREEEILSYIQSSDYPKLEQFEELLHKHAGDFHCQRTAKTLQNHWQLMRQYQLLCDQMPRPQHNNDQPLTFSDAEDKLQDSELIQQRDETLDIELALADRNEKRHIRILDTELSRWNVLIDSMTGLNNSPEFDSQTLAVLRGRSVRYLMRSKEITFGRDAKDQNVDVDLSLEGPALKISRRQGTIKLRSNGDFFIANEGKRPIYINGVPLATGNKARLANNFVLEICGMRLVFLTNYELINAIRLESAKHTATLN